MCHKVQNISLPCTIQASPASWSDELTDDESSNKRRYRYCFLPIAFSFQLFVEVFKTSFFDTPNTQSLIFVNSVWMCVSSFYLFSVFLCGPLYCLLRSEVLPNTVTFTTKFRFLAVTDHLPLYCLPNLRCVRIKRGQSPFLGKYQIYLILSGANLSNLTRGCMPKYGPVKQPYLK